MRHLYLLLLCLMIGLTLQAQKTIESTSSTYSFSITKEIKPPILTMVPNSLRFTDSNGNNAIDADERCQIEFEMTNVGIGDGFGLVLKTEAGGSSEGLFFEQTKKLEVLKVKEQMKVVLPISAKKNTTDGKVLFTFKVEEPNGFGSEKFQIEVTTNAFVEPLVRVVDYSITSERSGTLQRRFPFDLQVLIQNTKYGLAEEVNVSLSLPSNVFPLTNNMSVKFDQLEAGQTREMVYSLIVNDRYDQEEIPVKVNLKEKYGQYAESKTITLQLNQNMASNKIVVDARKEERKGDIEIASLRSDVDKGIPQVAQPNPHRYALIIGNEDYSSYQSGLSTEVNVDYAVNDAAVFKEYAVNTLGVPERQVRLLTDATTGQINQGLAWLANLAKQERGQAELIFYYSGHGLPRENTNEAYLIPVDVSGVNIDQAVPLKRVYDQLTQHPSQKVTVFLDACFSGGARNKPLLTTKVIRIRPKEEALKGNTVVFSSSSGEEASSVYREKQHGFFTYFLLKKLKESKGEVTYEELFDYVQQSVGKESGLISKPQTPDVQVSEAVKDSWQDWRVN